MTKSVNKVILVGNVGGTPEIKVTQQGNEELAIFSLATGERWKDKTTGEVKEKTEWHRVVVFAQGLVLLVKNYIKKGSKIYLEGSIQTREYSDPQTGDKKYTTEIVLRPFASALVLLDKKSDIGSSQHVDRGNKNVVDLVEEEIPF